MVVVIIRFRFYAFSGGGDYMVVFFFQMGYIYVTSYIEVSSVDPAKLGLNTGGVRFILYTVFSTSEA